MKVLSSAQKFAQYINPEFVELLQVFGYGRTFVKAQDIWIWDDYGNRYLDCLAGFGSINIGHNHPRLMQRLKDLLNQNPLHFCHIGPSAEAAELAEYLIHLLPEPFKICLFANTGAEAIESAMKLARVATRRKKFLYCENSFHGVSFATLSIMGDSRLRQAFEPLLNDCQQIPFGDLVALEKILRERRTAAFIVEPIQAEGGVAIPPQGYLQEVQKLCRRYGTLLILDEIQTGLGRTGSCFAFEQEGLIPDILVLAKALSGGMVPIGMAITSREIHQKAYGKLNRFDWHSSTFGRNALASVAALETMKILTEEKLISNSLQTGKWLLEQLSLQLKDHPLIKSIRGRGLLIGLELGPTEKGFANRLLPQAVKFVSKKMLGQWLALRLLEAGIICQPTAHHWNVLKIEPPLTLQKQEGEFLIKNLVSILNEYQGLATALKDVGKRLIHKKKRKVFDDAT